MPARHEMEHQPGFAGIRNRYPARVSQKLLVRQQGQPKAVRDIAWRAQLRLCSRYRRLSARGMHANKICVAIARELAAFVWDVARHAPPMH